MTWNVSLSTFTNFCKKRIFQADQKFPLNKELIIIIAGSHLTTCFKQLLELTHYKKWYVQNKFSCKF